MSKEKTEKVNGILQRITAVTPIGTSRRTVWEIEYLGKKIIDVDLAAILPLPLESVKDNMRKFRNDIEGLNLWIADIMLRNKLKLSHNNKIFRKDNDMIWAKKLVDEVGINNSQANGRIQTWLAGDIGYQQMFMAQDVYTLLGRGRMIDAVIAAAEKQQAGDGNWGGLSNEERIAPAGFYSAGS
jgi:predicted nucleic acid-binding protein